MVLNDVKMEVTCVYVFKFEDQSREVVEIKLNVNVSC